MADGFFEYNEENIRKVIRIIRKYTPEIILCNAPEDRHPDHGRSSKLVTDAAFLSGLRKIETRYNNEVQKEWRPSYVFHYLQDRYLKPDFVYDISDFHEQKINAILCYTTQFYSTDSTEPETYISTPDFIDTIKARALMLGKRIGVKFAEGYLTQKMIGIKSFDSFIQHVT
jgi:bacillithiol biosynthesis deacetylase BshB1